ncbi:MAG: tripartite tricarboxylate transporter TctB family protein [Pelagimonas sp.]|uniref:tripartite tricarboxylate transporter TctB family protein n=1 Tax=Pelagimonas sp. TaxID=2073170 RepID=UPI003D6C637B
MGISADRISGAFFFLLGLALYFFVIPTYVETVEGSNLAPKTVPNYISIIIAICGAFLVLKPTEHQTQSLRAFLVTGAYAAILAIGIFAMSLFGFEYVAPVMAFVIMWMIGERRPLWFGAGTILMPLIIWFLVTYPLGRALP